MLCALLTSDDSASDSTRTRYIEPGQANRGQDRREHRWAQATGQTRKGRQGRGNGEGRGDGGAARRRVTGNGDGRGEDADGGLGGNRAAGDGMPGWVRERRRGPYLARKGYAVGMDGLLKGKKVSPQDGWVDVVDRRQSTEARVVQAGVSCMLSNAPQGMKECRCSRNENWEREQGTRAGNESREREQGWAREMNYESEEC